MPSHCKCKSHLFGFDCDLVPQNREEVSASYFLILFESPANVSVQWEPPEGISSLIRTKSPVFVTIK